MKIAFDVDGVVLRSIDVILEHINETTCMNLTPDDLTSWDLEPLGLDIKTLYRAVNYMYSQPIIEPYEGALEVLSLVYHESREPLLFITGRTDPGTARRQLEALPWNPNVPEMIVTGGNRDKRRYLTEQGVDFIIEDDTRHVRDYLEMGIGVGLMIQPWNRLCDLSGVSRFAGWPDLENWFREISRKSNY